MADIKQFPGVEDRPKYVYELDQCAGCQKVFEYNEEYLVVVLPNGAGTVKKHIALCDSCQRVAEGYGIL